MDPLSSLVTLIRPEAVVSKVVSGSGRWAVHSQSTGNVGFGVILRGDCHLFVERRAPVTLVEGDFILLPSPPNYILASHLDLDPSEVGQNPSCTVDTTERYYGDLAAEPDFELLGGYFRFSPVNLSLLGSILPPLIHVSCLSQTAGRLTNTVNLLAEEARQNRPGRDLVLERLIDVLLIEALRYGWEQSGLEVQPGLSAGLADSRVGRALNSFHANVAATWSVAALADEAHMSRTAFSERFTRLMGMSPMAYVLDWRMALAKDMLQRERVPQDKVAASVGYQSASAFNTAFRRQVGKAPGEYRKHCQDGWSWRRRKAV